MSIIDDLKIIEQDGRYIIPWLEWKNKFYPPSLKFLGKKLGMRSDKFYRMLEKFGVRRIYYCKIKGIRGKDDSFYFTTREGGEQAIQWIQDYILIKQISNKLFN